MTWTNPHRQWFDDQLNRLKDRLGPGMSQNRVADYLKINKAGLSRRLDGSIKFRLHELRFLAGLFEVEIGDIVTKAEDLRTAWELARAKGLV